MNEKTAKGLLFNHMPLEVKISGKEVTIVLGDMVYPYKMDSKKSADVLFREACIQFRANSVEVC